MTKRLGRGYYGFIGVMMAAVGAGAIGGADAGEQPPAPFVFASGYGAETDAPSSVARRPEGGRARAVSACLEAAADRYEGEVDLAQVNRAWEGREGWIVDLSLDVSREGKRSRRRDVACRQSAHGLQVARY